MKKFSKYFIGIFYLSMIMIVSSCSKNYMIEYLDEQGEVIEEENFQVSDDTSAYMEAWKKFCITIKVEKEMKEKFNKDIKTKDFRVLDENRRDITSIEFEGKEERKEEIFRIVNEIEDVIPDFENSETVIVDTAKIKNLESYFNIEEDEFDVDKQKWFKPKSAPKYVNYNAVYFYFGLSKKGITKLRLRFQYSADDWLFIKNYVFNIDGFPIEFTPSEVKRDNANGKIWEWSDDPMTPFEANLVELIECAKAIKVKIEGSNYYKVKNLTSKEIEAMKKTIELYKAYGGKI